MCGCRVKPAVRPLSAGRNRVRRLDTIRRRLAQGTRSAARPRARLVMSLLRLAVSTSPAQMGIPPCHASLPPSIPNYRATKRTAPLHPTQALSLTESSRQDRISSRSSNRRENQPRGGLGIGNVHGRTRAPPPNQHQHQPSRLSSGARPYDGQRAARRERRRANRTRWRPLCKQKKTRVACTGRSDRDQAMRLRLHREHCGLKSTD